ncbi:MAG: MaoC family dehydratase [Burkholderiales bacterium]|nr:MaoC family dehydratase [Burkholderiales bacterium]
MTGPKTAKLKLNDPAELVAYEGKEVVVSDWITVTQKMIDDFADATLDHQWIHVDAERSARESPFKATVAHGFLTLSLLSRFLNESIDLGVSRLGVNYGLNRVRFTDPVRVNSRLRAHFALDDLQRLDGGVQMVWKVTIESEGSDKPALIAEWLTRRYE